MCNLYALLHFNNVKQLIHFKMSSEFTNIKEFLQQYLEIAPDTVCIQDKNIDELIKSDMKLDDTVLNRLKDVCQ